jgi:hypothetical protein
MRSLTRFIGSPRRLAVLALSLALVCGGVAPAQAAVLPPGPSSPAPAPDPIDIFAPYQPQTTCDPTDKPGAQYIMNMVLSYYKVGHSFGISRSCSVAGTSEHKEGRALDWGVSVDNPAEKAAGDDFTNWLTAVGPDGKPGYNARRLGVMYVIWNRQIWGSYSASAGWKPYTGAVPHTDHVHVSLSWNGAYMNSSWWTGVAVPTDATTRRYVAQVYRDLFNRQPDPAGLATWATALANGTPRVAVANAITYSTEFRTGLIRGSYQRYLGREPDAAGLATWLAAMERGWTVSQIESGFIASDEYYANAGSTYAAWVARLYTDVLDRAAAPSEVAYWTQRLEAGARRDQVAMGFLLSTERLSTVVNGHYLHLLGRGIDPSGQATWVGILQAGGRDEAIIGGIIASAEYYANAAG